MSESFDESEGDNSWREMTHEQREAYTTQKTRCFEESNLPQSQKRLNFMEALPPRAMELMAGIEQGSSPEMLEAADLWGKCMIEAGYQFEGRYEALNYVEREIERILGADSLTFENPSELIIQEAKQLEKEFFLAETECWKNHYKGVLDSHVAELDGILSSTGVSYG